MTFSLPSQHFSLDHHSLLNELKHSSKNFLIIQDLDGVCMRLERDPKQRRLDENYIRASRKLAGHFYVLTNGEHTGNRGVNTIVDQSFASWPPQYAHEHGLYLPGLAAGGVQWQDCFGSLAHPGVTPEEMDFLRSIPNIMETELSKLLKYAPYHLNDSEITKVLSIIVLGNMVSPTVNIGSLYDDFADNRVGYIQLQTTVMTLMSELLERAKQQGLASSFFVHLAPNLVSENGTEQLKLGSDTDMGTTDFQFMLRGAVKEAGVMVLLNRYYHQETGSYPLGEAFNARTAPKNLQSLLSLAKESFDPAIMPRIIGVGDTVTSSLVNDAKDSCYQRGGSDRGFLTLVQELGKIFHSENAVLFVDSSRGDLKRPGVDPLPAAAAKNTSLKALNGITDEEDLLQLNFIFTGGHEEYTRWFMSLSESLV